MLPTWLDSKGFNQISVPPGLEIWMFGSALTANCHGDVDLIVVYPDGDIDGARTFQQYLDDHCHIGLLDITLLSHSEARVTRFLHSTDAVQLLQ